MSDRVYVATRKGLFTVDRGSGATAEPWSITRTAFAGDNVTLVMHDPRDGMLLAALDHGHFGVKMHRSRDAGETWSEIAAPTYPEEPPDAEPVINPMNQEPIPWKLNLVWALAPGGGQQPGVIWCGTVPGGLFRSNDAGDSWTLVRSLWDHEGRRKWFGGGLDLPGIHSICVDPRDADRVTLGVSCGGVWVTLDGGKTWACKADGMWASYMPPDEAKDPGIQDPHCVVQCAGGPEHFWAQHHNGIFRSTDGCDSWSEIAQAGPSTFGFPVAVHPKDPLTAWFVPGVKDEQRIPVDAKVVVTRTRDGGKSFDVLSDGLPSENAYDIAFRHALDVDETGDRLAMGSTTGSLWVSEDQGSRWACVSTHLPPIYCVRFAKSDV